VCRRLRRPPRFVVHRRTRNARAHRTEGGDERVRQDLSPRTWPPLIAARLLCAAAGAGNDAALHRRAGATRGCIARDGCDEAASVKGALSVRAPASRTAGTLTRWRQLRRRPRRAAHWRTRRKARSIATEGGDERAGVKRTPPAPTFGLRQNRNARGERRDQGRAHSSMTHSVASVAGSDATLIGDRHATRGNCRMNQPNCIRFGAA
jgi:hypothetical protein